jgi:hypothetical protein
MAQYLEWFGFHPAVGAAPKTEPTTPSWVDAEIEVSVATWQAYQILYYGYIALFVVAGFDKFLRLMTSWDNLAAPGIAATLHLSTGSLSVVAGVVELLIAAGVALKPRIGSWMATIWLWLVIINLLVLQGHFEMLLLTAALSVAGVAFTRLSAECN